MKKQNQDLIDMQNAAIALGKCGVSTKQFKKINYILSCVDNMSKSITKLMFGMFAIDNKQVLIEDYTRQAIL